MSRPLYERWELRLAAHPKPYMWLCRISPFLAWGSIAGMSIAFPSGHAQGTAEMIRLGWLTISLLPYFLAVFVVMPQFLLPQRRRLVVDLGYFVFTCATIGIGSCLWYFIRVDQFWQKGLQQGGPGNGRPAGARP